MLVRWQLFDELVFGLGSSVFDFFTSSEISMNEQSSNEISAKTQDQFIQQLITDPHPTSNIYYGTWVIETPFYC